MITTLVPKKFLTATLTLILLVLASFQAALVGGFTTVEALQLAALFVGGLVTYYAPLLEGKWPAALKVIGAVVGAVLVAVIGVINGAVEGVPTWDVSTITLVVFAGFNALAAQYGVDQRVDAAKEALAAPEVTNAQVQTVDPKAAQIAVNQG